jgi:hypothetical protein
VYAGGKAKRVMTGTVEDIRVRVDLTAVVIAVRSGVPYVLTVGNSASPPSPLSLPSGPLQPGHQSLQAGLRNWVERQTHCQLGYVEQLYTFADRTSAPPGSPPGINNRAISIAYLALVSIGSEDLPIQEGWQPWYQFFPWEDMRFDEPPSRILILNRLLDWARSLTARRHDKDCVGRLFLTFGAGGVPWDEERALERYEMLYDVRLVPEASFDRGLEPSADLASFAGLAMVADHRRILATAISRLRAKIKYRPVLFELMPPTFTLSALQKTAEALSGVSLHKQNFRRLIAQQGLVEETEEIATDTGGRPAKLMRFRSEVTLERPAPGVRLAATRRGGYP